MQIKVFCSFKIYGIMRMEQNKFDELLVSSVEQYPHLYDKNHMDYKNDRTKQNSWVSIASYLNTDPDIVKKRWNNLRDRFVRAHRDFTSGSETTPLTINFPYFEIMLWLAPHLRKRKLTSPVFPQREKQIRTIPIQVSENEDTFSKTAPESESLENKLKFEINDDDMYTISEDDTILSSPAEPRTSKKYDLYENISVAAQSFSTLVNHKLKTKPVSVSQNTSDINFMKSVTEDMEMISPKNKIKFKREVMQLLEKYADME